MDNVNRKLTLLMVATAVALLFVAITYLNLEIENEIGKSGKQTTKQIPQQMTQQMNEEGKELCWVGLCMLFHLLPSPKT